MKSISENEAKKLPLEKVITLTNKPGKFFLKAESLEDRYNNNPDLQKLCLSQFVKRMIKSGKIKYEEEMTQASLIFLNVYHLGATFTIGGERCPGMVQATRLKEIYSRIIIVMSHAKR